MKSSLLAVVLCSVIVPAHPADSFHAAASSPLAKFDKRPAARSVPQQNRIPKARPLAGMQHPDPSLQVAWDPITGLRRQVSRSTGWLNNGAPAGHRPEIQVRRGTNDDRRDLIRPFLESHAALFG